MKLDISINGVARSLEVAPRTSLADLLRSPEVRCPSVHLGCEHGVCGACTVLIDGRMARSCIALAVSLDGSEVTTLEGLESDPMTLSLKASFHRNHGLQCGFCTPAMLIAARETLQSNPGCNADDVRLAMSGNLCRCTGYAGIVEAILDVARAEPGTEMGASS